MSVRSLDEHSAIEQLVKVPENALIMGVSRTGPVSNQALARRQRGVGREVRSRPSGPVGLVCRDGINFSAGLRAILGCGRDVIIAPDDTPAVLSDIGDRVTAIVADFPTGHGHEVRVDEGDSEAAPDEVRAEGSPRVHFFTSGSSGERKLVTKTAAQLVGEAKLLEQMWGPVVEKGLIAGTVSHQHLYGFLFRIVWPAITGRPIYGPTLEAHRVAEVAAREGIGALVSCPAHLRRLPSLVKGGSDVVEFSCIFSSGGPLDFDTALACRRSLGSAPVEVYGSTETGGIAWRQQSDSDEVPFRPFPGVEVRVRREVLEINSPHADVGVEPWTTTADRVEMTEDGRFTLQGRVDRIAKISGKRVSLIEMEQRLLERPEVEEVAILPMVDEAGGRELTAALIVLSSHGRTRLKQEVRRELNDSLRAGLRESFPPEVIPRRWRYLSTIPINTQGKRVVSELRKLAEQRSDREVTRLEVLEVRREDTRAEFRCVIPENLSYFDGHFPNVPIVAGVVQLAWVCQLAKDAFEIQVQPSSLEGVKFHSLLRPREQITISLDWELNRRKLRYEICRASVKIASGRFVIQQ